MVKLTDVKRKMMKFWSLVGLAPNSNLKLAEIGQNDEIGLNWCLWPLRVKFSDEINKVRSNR